MGSTSATSAKSAAKTSYADVLANKSTINSSTKDSNTDGKALATLVKKQKEVLPTVESKQQKDKEKEPPAVKKDSDPIPAKQKVIKRLLATEVDEYADVDEDTLDLPGFVSDSSSKEKKSKDDLLLEEKRKNAFDIKVQPVYDENTGGHPLKECVVFKSDKLISTIKKLSTVSTLYSREPTMVLQDLAYKVMILENLYKEAIKVPALTISLVPTRFCYAEELKYTIDTLYEKHGDEFEKVKNMQKEKVIDFFSLWYIFYPGVAVSCYNDEGKQVAGIINTSLYQGRGADRYFTINVNYVVYCGKKKYQWVTKPHHIRVYDGTLPSDSLPIKFLTDETKEALYKRGKRYAEVTKKPFHSVYNNLGFKRNHYGDKVYVNIEGRIIIDTENFNKNNANCEVYKPGRTPTNLGENIPDNLLYNTWSHVPGYSFVSPKGWFEFDVEEIIDITYDDNVFDCLVVPDMKLSGTSTETDEKGKTEKKDVVDLCNRKDLILALIKNRKDTLTDIVKGKSGGLIFLLHGPPGVGKTLTAEATAEVLHTPLYSVSVGELGDNVVGLEKKLDDVLQLSQSWDAVTLLDEADIFLEARDTSNITRNAIVGLFLKRLEYHNGIIFLTSNRAKNIDSAIMSRISLVFDYKDLTQSARAKVWENLLGLTKIVGIDVKYLSKFELNGRQIKNAIRLAQSYSMSKKTPLTTTHIEQIIKISIEGLSS